MPRKCSFDSLWRLRPSQVSELTLIPSHLANPPVTVQNKLTRCSHLPFSWPNVILVLSSFFYLSHGQA